MKKFIALLLVFSILNISCATISSNHAETKVDPKKKGANLIIQKKAGQSVRGELIAVKQNSLLLKDRDSGADVTVDIEDVSVIRIVRKTKYGIGYIMGMVAGIAVVSAINIESIGWIDFRPAMFGIAGALVGGIIGSVISVILGKDVTIQFSGKSDSEIQEILEKLRKKARVRNAW